MFLLSLLYLIRSSKRKRHHSQHKTHAILTYVKWMVTLLGPSDRHLLWSKYLNNYHCQDFFFFLVIGFYGLQKHYHRVQTTN